MKLRKFLLIATLSALLTSCNNNSKLMLFKNGAILNIENNTSSHISDYTNTIDSKKLSNLLDSKESFAFYYYSNNCESCTEVSKNIKQYIVDSKSLIYSASIDDITFASYQDLSIKYEGILKEYSKISLPYFAIFSDGKLYNELPYEMLTNYQELQNYLNKNIDNKNMYLTTNYKDTKSLIFNYETKYVYYYERTNKLANDVLKQIVERGIATNKKIIVVDELSFNDEQDLADIHAYSGVSTNHKPIIIKYEKTRITARLELTENNLNYINNLIY